MWFINAINFPEPPTPGKLSHFNSIFNHLVAKKREGDEKTHTKEVGDVKFKTE